MERRNKARHSLQLLCRADGGAVRSAAPEGITENMSRDGILMRWLDDVPLPEIGSPLVVELELPAESAFEPRVMHCRTTVVRITKGRDGQKSVGLRIEHLGFRRAGKTAKGAGSVHSPAPDLASMAPASNRVS